MQLLAMAEEAAAAEARGSCRHVPRQTGERQRCFVPAEVQLLGPAEEPEAAEMQLPAMAEEP